MRTFRRLNEYMIRLERDVAGIHGGCWRRLDGGMTGPDPNAINAANWAATSDLLAALWLLLGSAVGFGGSMLLAHGMIPSLTISREIPASVARRIRPPLYLAALVFLALVGYAVIVFIDRLDVISAIFYRGAQ